MWSEKGDVSYNPIFFRDCIVPRFGFSGILCKSYWGSCDILYTIYVFIYTYIYVYIYICARVFCRAQLFYSDVFRSSSCCEGNSSMKLPVRKGVQILLPCFLSQSL